MGIGKLCEVLIVRLKKQQGKRNTIICIREDGSSTYAAVAPGNEFHELAHYAVETELRCDRAFYGLVAAGYDISDFTLPESDRPDELKTRNLPVQSLQVEHLTNLLRVSKMQDQGAFDLITEFKLILADAELPFPNELDRDSLLRIKQKLNRLLDLWQNVPVGEVLELEVDLGGGNSE